MRAFAILIATAVALAACNRTPTSADAMPAASSVPVAASTSTATPLEPTSIPQASAPGVPQAPEPMPEGSYANYQCNDGAQIEVHFNGIAATVAWPDGRTAQLSQRSSAGEGERQVYADRGVEIARAGDGLHLRDGRNAETLCTETSASA